MKVEWVRAASQDRVDIVDHIGADNPRAAARMDLLFGEAAAKLGDFPMLGHVGAIPGTRELFPHRNYRLVYEVDEAADTVWVLTLVHASRQWPPIRE